MRDWTEFGLRHLPTMSAVEPFSPPPEMAPVIEGLMAVVQQSLTVPVRGITSDGAVTPGVFPATAGRTSTGAIREAAAAFLGSLNATDAQSAQFPVDAEQWRTWFNIHPYVLRHGVMLANLSARQRRLALEVVRATLSARGFEQGRNVMRLNGLLASITSSPTEYD
jgi:hypothetical protein